MRVLKAYAEAAAYGQTYGHDNIRRTEFTVNRPQSQTTPGGDTLHLSATAQEMLQAGFQPNVSVCPQDATYDSHGHVMRQFDTLQGELRGLAAKLVASPSSHGMLGQLNYLQAQVAGLRAMV